MVPKKNFRLIFFSVSVFIVPLVPLTAVCILFRNFSSMIFSCSVLQHFSDFVFSARYFSSDFVLVIMIWFAMSPSASQPTYRGIFGLLSAETDSFDQLDRYNFPSFRLIRLSVFYRGAVRC